jgi:hypothetical protein
MEREWRSAGRAGNPAPIKSEKRFLASLGMTVARVQLGRN